MSPGLPETIGQRPNAQPCEPRVGAPSDWLAPAKVQYSLFNEANNIFMMSGEFRKRVEIVE
jgi:hypothetical protein